jgi:hypothetical protein
VPGCFSQFLDSLDRAPYKNQRSARDREKCSRQGDKDNFLRVGSAQRTTARHLSGGYIRRCNVTTGIRTSLIPPGTRLSVPPTPRPTCTSCDLSVSRFGVDRCRPEEDSGAQPVHLRDFTDPYSRPIHAPSNHHQEVTGTPVGTRVGLDAWALLAVVGGRAFVGEEDTVQG